MTTLLNYSLDDLLIECRKIVRSAGNILLKYFESNLEMHFKGRFDMCTNADLASEAYLIEKITELTPDIGILSEEAYSQHRRNWLNRRQWIIDPLDGTTNFAHKLPHFCISVALVDETGVSSLGIIFDPCRDELFYAQKGKGAFLNQHMCHVSSTTELEYSLTATGFPYSINKLKRTNLVEFAAFRLRSQGVRRLGAAALDLAYVAAGRLDGFWERWLNPWDTAAGLLLVSEAGGQVSRFDGSEYSITDKEIAASNGLIHSKMLDILSFDWPELPSVIHDPDI